MNSTSTRPPLKLIRAESQRVLQRCSEAMLGATSDASDDGSGGNSLNGNNNNMNLQQDYDNAIECLIQCECLIKSMEHQIESRDEHIESLEKKAEAATKNSALDDFSFRLRMEVAAKDARIEALEGQLVRMSLELASTKARQDELQHKLKSTSVVSVGGSSNNGSSNNANASFASQQQQGGSSMPALNDGAVYKPVSNRDRRKRQTWFGMRMVHVDAAADGDDAITATTSSPPDTSVSRRASCSSVLTSFTNNQTSFTSEAKSSFNSGQGDPDEDSVGPSRLTAFGQLLGLRGGSNRRGFGDNIEVYFPPKAIQEDERKEDEEEARGATAASTAAPTPWWGGGGNNNNEKRRQAEAASELNKAMLKKSSKKDLKMTFAQQMEAAVPSKKTNNNNNHQQQQQHFGLQVPTKTGAASNSNCNNNGNGRRDTNLRRNAMMKSSRSFLENRGVVFPVSSFEVLNKGCLGMSPGDDAAGGGLNCEWPEFQ